MMDPYDQPDSLLRFVFDQAPVRGEIVNLSASWREVLGHADYPQPVQRLLGELMAAAALLTATLKFSGSLILQLHGRGPVRLVVVECTSGLNLRAAAKWEGEVADSPLPELLGEGRFAMTLDQGDPKKKNYQGIVPLDADTVAGVLEHYMARSEQLETKLVLAADAHRAAGLLIQGLPDQEAVDSLLSVPDADAWNRAERLAATLTAAELLNLPATAIVRRLYHEEDIRVFERQPVCFRCSCSRERVSNMLRLLGEAEVSDIVAERGEVEVRCEFCNRLYRFDPIDAKQLFSPVVPVSTRRFVH
jgi:molecular chaperone Hsp33